MPMESWFLFRAVPMRNEQNNVVRWYETNTDIEDRKHLEETLRREKVELRLDYLSSSIIEGICPASNPAP